MKRKIKVLSIGKLLENILELVIPASMFAVLFISFVLGVFFRYVLKNPQSWTFELSSICYLSVGVLSWGISHRTDDHVVFDMFYTKVSTKMQCLFRILSNLLIVFIALMLIVPSITYLQAMVGLKTEIMKIPRVIVFAPFTISFIVAVIRSTYRLILDIISFARKDYTQVYNKAKEEENI